MAEEEEDYMGDLSLFLPPEEISSPSTSSRKISDGKPTIPQPSKKKPKTLNWQEQRKIDRERKQREEDQQTLANCESAIPSSNVGFKMLQKMGYNPGKALGKDGHGRAEPVGIEIRRSRAGLGNESPTKEKERKETFRCEKKRKEEEELMVEFGSFQKKNWRSRRIVADFNKAKAALLQLEGKDSFEEEKEKEEDGDDEKGEEEEEEEVITEEDLLDILTKLRHEHRYCLYCGFQYESEETLSSNCPGIGEDDH